MIALADDSAAYAESVPSLRVSLRRDPHAPARARAAVTRFTNSSSGIVGLAHDTLTLLVSELVSNAVLHSDAPPASEILLCARVLERGTVRVEVMDRGSGFTAAPRDPSRVTGGYGLFLVAQQANRWGVDREGGTRVWFELELRSRPRS
jgi:anti-sigma regulatory factor (Ser/Thr protein kinase)